MYQYEYFLVMIIIFITLKVSVNSLMLANAFVHTLYICNKCTKTGYCLYAYIHMYLDMPLYIGINVKTKESMHVFAQVASLYIYIKYMCIYLREFTLFVYIEYVCVYLQDCTLFVKKILDYSVRDVIENGLTHTHVFWDTLYINNVYVYMYIYICMCVCMCMYMYMYMCVCMIQIPAYMHH